ncbi:transcription factor TFIIIC subunit tfc4, partial [Coemansia aciculifera]
MALIREEEGRSRDAMHLYIVAAHLMPSDTDLWERLYTMHAATASDTEDGAKAGDPAFKATFDDATKHALYCLGFIIRNNPDNKVAHMNKLEILRMTENYKGMAVMYRRLLKSEPYNMDLIRQATLVFTKFKNDADTPIKWFSEALALYNSLAVKATEDVIAQSKAKRGRRGKSSCSDDSDAESDSEPGDDDDNNDELTGDEEWAEYYRSNDESTLPMDEVGGYTYSDLNMLAELRILRQDYMAAIADVKCGARFIQGRGRAKYWADMELEDTDDSEYSVNVAADGTESGNVLPIELRVRLGQCRIMLGDVESANAHFKRLFDFDVAGYPDLYGEVGDSYMASGHYEPALRVLHSLANCDDVDALSNWEKMAKCYRELKDFQNACKYANMVIDADENDFEMHIWLGDLYEEMGQFDMAMAVINRAEKAEERVRVATAAEAAAKVAAATASRSLTGANGIVQLSPAVEIWDEPSHIVQIEARKPSEKALRQRKVNDEQTQSHLQAMRAADLAFKKLDLLKSQIDKDQDPDAVAEYCGVAKRMYHDWTQTAAFYTTDRNKPFRNYRSHVLTRLENNAKSGGVDIQSSSAGQAAMRRDLDLRRKRISNKQNHKGAYVVDDKD